jgi:DNA modification methylase
VSCRIIVADVLDGLARLEPGSVQCVVTSPPYWGLRDYGHPGQIGLEPTPDEYVARLVAVFREVWRVLRTDGTLWLNLGDCYNAYNGGAGPGSGPVDGPSERSEQRPRLPTGYGLRDLSLKPKDLVGIPWRVAFALQEAGWWLRSDIIWAKPNPMPESIRDRPTRAHEYLFLMAKSERYYYDGDAILEPLESGTSDRLKMLLQEDRIGGKHQHADDPLLAASAHTQIGRKRAVAPRGRYKHDEAKIGHRAAIADANRVWHDPQSMKDMLGGRNKRSVWTIATVPYPGAHFAVFPPKLVEPCILAGSRVSDMVLDPFCGAGTTGLVADRLGRSFVGIEIRADYAELAETRIRSDAPLFAEIESGAAAAASAGRPEQTDLDLTRGDR